MAMAGVIRMSAIMGGVAKALSVGMQMPQLPAMRVSRNIHRYEGGKSRRTTTMFKDSRNGKRERERRQRQIANGSLKAENGLVL